jgi:hypothetical protein
VNISKLFPHAAVFQVSYSPAVPPSYEPKRRQGAHPLVVPAVESTGEIKADLIISEEDAAAIQAIDEQTNILKQCKVVIVVAGP